MAWLRPFMQSEKRVGVISEFGTILEICKGVEVSLWNLQWFILACRTGLGGLIKFQRKTCCSRGRVFLAGVESSTNPVKPKQLKGKGSLGERLLFLIVASHAPIWPSPPAVVHDPLPRPPLPAVTPWVGPWWLANSRPIRYQEQRGGEKYHFLFTPYPWSTRGSAVVNNYWYVNGLTLRPGWKLGTFWVKTSICLTDFKKVLLKHCSVSEHFWYPMELVVLDL